MAPSSGEATAMMARAIVVASASRPVACSGLASVASASAKYGGNSADTTVVMNTELAQSYMAQARSSGRPRPILANTPTALRPHHL